MKMKAHALMMITSFIPVVVFKVIARVGNVTIGQARVAAGLGLILALAQFVAAKKFLKRTTYLERAFLGFSPSACSGSLRRRLVWPCSLSPTRPPCST